MSKVKKTLFKRGKNLDRYKIELKQIYGNLGIAAKDLGVSLSSLYAMFNGQKFCLKVHKAISDKFYITWHMYRISVIEEVYTKVALKENNYEY